VTGLCRSLPCTSSSGKPEVCAVVLFSCSAEASLVSALQVLWRVLAGELGGLTTVPRLFAPPHRAKHLGLCTEFCDKLLRW